MTVENGYGKIDEGLMQMAVTVTDWLLTLYTDNVLNCPILTDSGQGARINLRPATEFLIIMISTACNA